MQRRAPRAEDGRQAKANISTSGCIQHARPMWIEAKAEWQHRPCRGVHPGRVSRAAGHMATGSGAMLRGGVVPHVRGSALGASLTVPPCGSL